jgi:crossover junction endodeoxyribonuclease RuvC
LKILGLDPGLGTTGWGLIEAQGNRLSHVANGEFSTKTADPLPQRLADLAGPRQALLAEHQPETAAGEEACVHSTVVASHGFCSALAPANTLLMRL